MAELTIHNLPEAVDRALRQRAKAHGRSAEAEVRDILVKAVATPERIGSTLAAYWREHAGADLQVDERVEAPRTVSFE